MGHVVFFDRGPRLDHALEIALRRLEQKRFLPVSVHDPRMLARRGRLTAAHDAADEELGFDADLNELPPGPQGEIFAVTALAPLEVARLLPEVRFRELVDITDVLAGAQPRHDVVD